MINTKYIKKQISFPLCHAAFYIAAIILSVSVSFNFFIRQQFFAGNGTTDLTLFFSFIPYVSIIIIPALCFKTSEYNYENFVCASKIEKITGYFLSVFVEYFLMILFLIPACLTVNFFGTIDYGQMFAGFFCLLLYGAATISVCILINQIVNTNVIAFIVSSLILVIFNSAHLFTVYANLIEFIRNISKSISFAWHFDAASKGIVDSRDVTYFIGILFLFLYIDFLVLEKKAGKKWNKKDLSRNTAVFFIAVLFIANGSRWYFRWDLSKNKTFSVSAYSKQLIKKVDEPIKITYYRSKSLSRLYPQVRDVSDFLKIYVSQSKKLNLVIKDPDNDENLKSLLEEYGVTSRQLRNVKNNSTEFVNVYSAITMEYNGNTECIPFIMSADSLEYDLDGRLKHLVTGKNKIVNIVVGNGLSIFDDYGFLIPWLNSQGIICNPLFIEDPNFANELYRCEGPLLVIGDSEIKIDAAIAIEDYILSKKGNAILNISPFSVDIENDWSMTRNKNTNLVEMVENWGITFEESILGDISCSRITMMSEDENQQDFLYQTNTNTQMINYPLWINIPSQENSKQGMTLFWPVKMSIAENVNPYIVTSPYSFDFEIDRNSPQKLIETNPFILQTVNIFDREKSQNVAVAEITGKLNGFFNMAGCDFTRVLVIPDPYFLNTLMTGYNGGEYGDYRNFDFTANLLLRLNDEAELADLQDKINRNSTLYKISDVYTFVRLQMLTMFITMIFVPGLIIMLGVGVWLIRKRKRTLFCGQLLQDF